MSSSASSVARARAARCCGVCRSSGRACPVAACGQASDGNGLVPTSRRTTAPSGWCSDHARSRLSATSRVTDPSTRMLLSRRNRVIGVPSTAMSAAVQIVCETDDRVNRASGVPHSRYHRRVTSPPDVESDLGWALGTVTRSYLRVAADAVADLPGGPRGYQVLSSAARGDRGSQLAMAQRLGVDRTVMTYLLDDLEKAGLVERKPDPADRRARRVVLTEAGRARLCDVERRLHRVEEHVLGPPEPAEGDALRTRMRRVGGAWGEEHVDACKVAAKELDRCSAE